MTFRRARHCFRFKVEGEPTWEVWAKVKDARAPLDLIVTADDVRLSMERNGVGDTRNCTMALCAKRHADKFSHPVEGYIDWQYRTCYVVSKLRRGLPSECVVYLHDNKIARLNDSKNGQRKLLAMLEADGPIKIRLSPIGLRRRKKKAAYSRAVFPDRGWQPEDIGVRKAKVHRGAAARFAYARNSGAL